MFAFRSNDDFSDEPKHLWSLASQKVLFMYLIIDKKILMNLIGAAALDPTFNGGKEADICKIYKFINSIFYKDNNLYNT